MAFLGIFDPGLTQAQNTDPPPASSSSASDETLLPEVTVQARDDNPGALPPAYTGGHVATGGRVGLLGNKDFMETPLSAINYTEKFIQDRQAQDIQSVIAATDPAVYNSGSTGMLTEQYSLRGFRVSTNDIALGGLYGMAPYWRAEPEIAERIEVLKGPSALLNGMPPGGSVGGSVNILPKRADDAPLTRISTGYFSDRQWGAHLDVGRRFGPEKAFGVRFNGVYRNGDTAVNHQDKNLKFAALGLDWRSEKVRVSADFYHSDEHLRGLNRGVSLAAGVPLPSPPKPETLLGPAWTFGKTKDRAAIFRGEFDIAENLTAYAAFGKSKTDFDAVASSLYEIYNAAGDFRNNYAHQRIIVDKESAEIGARGKFNTGNIGHEVALTATHYAHDYRFGFRVGILATPWLTNIYHPVWGPGVDTSFSHAHVPKTAALQTRSYGVADTLSFAGDRVQLTLGARRQEVVSDTFNATTGQRTARYDEDAITPAAMLLVKLTKQISAYANYIEGLSQGSTAPLTAANAGEVFAPYKTKQKEMGVKLDLGDFAATLSLFQIKQPNAYTDPTSNIYGYDGEQRNRGVELGFFGEPFPALRLMGGIAWTEAKLSKTAGGINEGRYVTGLPKWQGKLAAEWDIHAVQGLTLTGGLSAASRQYIDADNSRWVPGRAIYDVGARYRTTLGGRQTVFRADIRNVTNKAYWASGALYHGLGAPRTLMLSATVDF